MVREEIFEPFSSRAIWALEIAAASMPGGEPYFTPVADTITGRGWITPDQRYVVENAANFTCCVASGMDGPAGEWGRQFWTRWPEWGAWLTELLTFTQDAYWQMLAEMRRANEWFTVAQAADQLGRSERQVRRMIGLNHLRVKIEDGRYRVDPRSVHLTNIHCGRASR